MDDLLLDLIKQEDDLKILELINQDNNYKSIKVTALIRLKMYNDALVLLNGSHKLLQSYCLMKLNRLEEALNVIKEENGLQERLLTAQILNKLEQCEALEVYKELEEIEDLDQCLINDINANKIGVVARLGLDSDLGVIEGFGSFEQAYNYATLLIGRSDFQGAESALDIAGDILKNSMLEDVELELLVKLQKSVILQNKGYIENAFKILDSINEKDIQDENTKYILKCNVEKKSAVKDSGLLKMTLIQNKILEFNKFLKKSKKMSLDSIKASLDAHGNDENYQKLIVGAITKEKKGVQELKKLIQKYPKSRIFNLVLVQLSMEKKDFKSAEQVLSSFLRGESDYFRLSPSIVALRVFLSEKRHVLNIFKDALEFWRLRNDFSYRIILQKSADYKLECKMYREAALEYQELLCKDQDNEALIAALMTCFAGYDPLKAQGYALPNVSIPDDLNVDELEDFSEFLGKNVKIPRKRKRKVKHPKNFDPNVKPDPERWIPKSERSTCKKKKGKKEITGIGSQGLVSS